MLAQTKQLINQGRIDLNAPAIITPHRTITYQQFFSAVKHCSEQLLTHGIKEGDRIALLSTNSWQYIVTLVSLWSIKAIACPLNIYLPEESILAQIKEIDVQQLLSSKQYHLSNLAVKQLSLDDLFNFPCLSNSTTEISYHDNQEATIIFTTGSSGQPKPALHTMENHISSALSSNQMIPLTAGDQWSLSLPLYHVGGISILFRTFLSGTAMVVADSKKGTFQSIQNGHVTHLSCVSTQLARLLANQKNYAQLKKLKAILAGGSAIPESLLKQAGEMNLPLYTTYGLTEMSSQVATALYPQPAKLLAGVELMIADDGEVCVKGKPLFKGYAHGNQNHRPLDQDGWFHTGDLGNLDNGLTIIGRKDHMFISGGENIQPEEIERCLCQMKSIEQAVIIPAVDKEFGFRPIAFIKTVHNTAVNKEELVDYLKKYLPKFKIPDQYFVWSEKDSPQLLKVNRPNLTKQFLNHKSLLQEIH